MSVLILVIFLRELCVSVVNLLAKVAELADALDLGSSQYAY